MVDPTCPALPNDKVAVPRAFRSPRAWLALLTIFALGLGLDLGTKHWSFATVADVPVELDRQWMLEHPYANPIPPHQPRNVLPWNLLDLRLVINHGAVFGLGENRRIFFISFTLAALAAAVVFFCRFYSRSWVAIGGIGLILAGGSGNLYDRIRFGVVRDFLHMLPDWRLPFGWTWPGGSPELFPWVFNVADMMLLSGMALLMIHLNRAERHRRETVRMSPEIAGLPMCDARDLGSAQPHESSNSRTQE